MDEIISLAVSMIKENRTFNEFVKRAQKIINDELYKIWNNTWLAIEISEKITQKALENLEAEHDRN